MREHLRAGFPFATDISGKTCIVVRGDNLQGYRVLRRIIADGLEIDAAFAAFSSFAALRPDIVKGGSLLVGYRDRWTFKAIFDGWPFPANRCGATRDDYGADSQPDFRASSHSKVLPS
jgi:hypothetical protein